MAATENVQLLSLSSRSGVNWLPSITPMKTTIHCLNAEGNLTDQPEIAAIVTNTIEPSIQGSGSSQKANNRPPNAPMVRDKTRGLWLFITCWIIIDTCVTFYRNCDLFSRVEFGHLTYAESFFSLIEETQT